MSIDDGILEINWSEPFEMSAETSEDSIPEEYIQCLQKSFGHSRFRTMQWKVISSILQDARDNCVIMATGYGKSLCFQFPSVFRDTITLVVSPLISLMQDQVLAMRFYNLRACFLGSAQTNRDTLYEVIDRQYNIVYVTPEYITSESGDFLLERIQSDLTLIAIDEAHCISKWGHDFRSAYRHLRRLRELCPHVPILAMTATATEKVRDDIIDSLQLRDAQIVSTGFDRPNLEFVVKKKTKIWEDVGPYIKSVKIGSVIVYCISKRVTEEVAAVISAQGVLCGVYHAGRTLKQREQTHGDFIHDRIRVVVATIAFGMGINKPDVRLVIHYGVAKDVEGYYQEVGRAGRDGLPAKCIMFHCRKDWQLQRMIRDQCKLETSKEQMEALMLAMNKYVDTTMCRRRFILSYFGEDCRNLQMRRDCCDNCNHNRLSTNALQPASNLFHRFHGLDEDGLLDITDEAFKMLSLLREIAGKYGIRKAFLVLRGSQSKTVPAPLIAHSLFGSLKDTSEKWLQAISNSLLHIQMLTMVDVPKTNSFCKYVQSRCSVTSKGKVWLSGIINRDPIKIIPGDEIIRLLKPKVMGMPKILQAAVNKSPGNQPSTSAAAADNGSAMSSPRSSSDLYRPLLGARSKLAALFDVMPYLVASTRALQQMVQVQPTTMEELKSIHLDGYSEEKTERFGPVFLKVIKDYHVKIGNKAAPIQTGKLLENKQDVTIKSDSTLGAITTRSSVNEVNTYTIEMLNATKPLPTQDTDLQADNNLPSTQSSVEVIEPPPVPVVEIESDSDLDDNNYWTQINVQQDKQQNNIKNPEDSGSMQLDMLVDALISEDISENQAKAMEPRVIKKEPSTALEYEDDTDSDKDSDLFDIDWDLDIDESDLTQVTDQAEQQLKLSLGEATTATSSDLQCQTAEVKSELDLLIDAVVLDSNQQIRKQRVIEKKTLSMFEYEDESDSSESENYKQPVVSPKKRALPSWMQLSNKKRC